MKQVENLPQNWVLGTHTVLVQGKKRYIVGYDTNPVVLYLQTECVPECCPDTMLPMGDIDDMEAVWELGDMDIPHAPDDLIGKATKCGYFLGPVDEELFFLTYLVRQHKSEDLNSFTVKAEEHTWCYLKYPKIGYSKGQCDTILY